MKGPLLLILVLFLIPIVLAQPNIELKHIGYGKTPQEVHIQLSNTGNTTLTNIEIYVDNEKFETIQANLLTNKIIEYILYLTPGEHLIEAKTKEGAHDSFRINVPTTPESTPIFNNKKDMKSFLAEKKTEIIIGMFIIFFGIVVWILTRRPRLNLG